MKDTIELLKEIKKRLESSTHKEDFKDLLPKIDDALLNPSISIGTTLGNLEAYAQDTGVSYQAGVCFTTPDLVLDLVMVEQIYDKEIDDSEDLRVVVWEDPSTEDYTSSSQISSQSILNELQAEAERINDTDEEPAVSISDDDIFYNGGE